MISNFNFLSPMMFSLDLVYKIPSRFYITNISGLLFSQQKKAYELEKQLRQVNGMNHAILERNQELTGCNKKLEGGYRETSKTEQAAGRHLRDFVFVEI